MLALYVMGLADLTFCLVAVSNSTAAKGLGYGNTQGIREDSRYGLEL